MLPRPPGLCLHNSKGPRDDPTARDYLAGQHRVQSGRLRSHVARAERRRLPDCRWPTDTETFRASAIKQQLGHSTLAALGDSTPRERGPFRTNFGHLRGPGPAIKIPFWDPWETVLLGQILAGSLLEANFGNLRALGLAIKLSFWDPWETALLGQILAGEPFGRKFRQFEGPLGRQAKFPSGTLGNGFFWPKCLGWQGTGSKEHNFSEDQIKT